MEQWDVIILRLVCELEINHAFRSCLVLTAVSIIVVVRIIITRLVIGDSDSLTSCSDPFSFVESAC